MEEQELTYGERMQGDEFWEDVKVPFPEMDDIEWVMVEVPKWWNAPIANNGIALQENYEEHDFSEARHKSYKNIYENSQDFTVTWKLLSKDRLLQV